MYNVGSDSFHTFHYSSNHEIRMRANKDLCNYGLGFSNKITLFVLNLSVLHKN